MTIGRPSTPGGNDVPSSNVAAARPAAPAQPAAAARPISSDALFRGASELQITHRGSLYRLKQTALGKLILTK